MITDNTQQNYSVLDLGFNRLLLKNYIPARLLETETTPEMANYITSGVVQKTLTSGELLGNTVVKEGYLQSSNFVSGSTGWQLTPTSGQINFALSVSSINIPDSTTANSFHANSSGDTWWGCNVANFNLDNNNATAYILKTGNAKLSNIVLTGLQVGSAVNTTYLSGLVAQANLNIANRGWTQTSAFSVTDADTVAWGAGTFTSADGTAYSISGSNTGNMSAKTYIYLDTAVSTTAYQTTTTSTTAVGVGKVLIAIAQNGTGEATFQVLSGQGGQNIDAANIVANSITANELSTSITYAGSIIIDTAGLIRSGQTDYATGTGWWLGNAVGTPKFSIGSATNYLTWDGSVLTIGGKQNMLAGDILYAAADTTRSYAGAGGWNASVKTHTIKRGGTYRIKFDAWTNSGTAQARVYRNGSGVGAIQSVNTTPTTFSEDISGWSPDDIIQLYYNADGVTINLDNFRLYVLDFEGVTTVD